MKKNTIYLYLLLISILIIHPFYFVSASEYNTLEGLKHLILTDGDTLASYDGFMVEKDGTLYIESSENARAVEVTSWRQFCNALNNSNVNVINVSSSFSSSW